METFSALLALCAGNSPDTGQFTVQRPVTRSFDVFFDLRLNEPLSKQWWGWWFETLSRPLWRYGNAENKGAYTLVRFLAPFVIITADCHVLFILTHLPLDKMAAISQTTSSDAFSRMKSVVFWLKFHWSLFLRVQLPIIQHWFSWWLGAE